VKCLSLLAFILFAAFEMVAVAQVSSETSAHSRVKALKELARRAESVEFTLLNTRIDGDGIDRQLLRFQSDQLTQFALLLRPAGKAPSKGWPVVIFNHGTHPNPPQYGKNAKGDDSRPGDYYRALVQRYALSGFAVLAPDQRGHNQSQGVRFTQDLQSNYWYARDTIQATLALQSIEGLDLDRVYMAGHSRGGRISQLASLALGKRLNAVSIWSTGVAQIVMGDQLSGLQAPMQIQHGSRDRVTPLKSSLMLAENLHRLEQSFELHVYDTEKHLFQGDHFELAIEKDVRWFNAHP